MKHLDWYMTMKKTSDKRNAKYYAACLEGAEHDEHVLDWSDSSVFSDGLKQYHTKV